MYVRKKKKKKNNSFVSDLLRFSFRRQAVEGVPGRKRGSAGVHTYPGAHVTRPQPDFFAFDGLFTFERYKLPPSRQKCNRREIVAKFAHVIFFAYLCTQNKNTT